MYTFKEFVTVMIVLVLIFMVVLMSHEVSKVEKSVIVIESSFDYTNEKLQELSTHLKTLADGTVSLDVHISRLIELIRTEWIDIKGMEEEIKRWKDAKNSDSSSR